MRFVCLNLETRECSGMTQWRHSKLLLIIIFVMTHMKILFYRTNLGANYTKRLFFDLLYMCRECRIANANQTQPNFQPSVSSFTQNLKNGDCSYSFAEGFHAAQLINNSCNSFVKTGEVVVIESVSFLIPARMAQKLEKDLRISVYCELERPSRDILPLLDYIDEFDRCNTTSEAILSFRRLRSFFAFAFGGCAILLVSMIFGRSGAEDSIASM